ncbi:MAG: ABC transporter permease [Planctomycetes bacterium]|nr:ABC transporter permease [Planctomycetota bacterium]
MLPFGYVLRNLLRRGARSLATIGGIVATTLLVILMTAFADGMTRAATGSADDHRTYLLGVSAETDLVRSVIPRGNAENAAAAAPAVISEGGLRAASVELHIATRRGHNVGLVRGVTPAAYLVHPEVTVTAGREPRAPFEIMLGTLAAARMELDPAEAAVGGTLQLEHRDFEVVGHFAAPGTLYEAEIWARLPDVMLTTKREDVSCVVLRLAKAEDLGLVDLFVSNRSSELEVVAMPESRLLGALASSLTPIAALARWMALLAVVAGAFACANTMFAAVLARTRELATLRAIGYSPAAIALALVEESTLVAAIGGAIGTLLALALGDVSLRYPMGALSLAPDLTSRAVGLGAALVSGLVGGILPAVRAVRLPLTDALGGKA